MANRSQSGRCIINLLPDEILSAIYSNAASALDEDMARYRFPSVLCRVSRRWRTVSQVPPQIWAFMLICDLSTLQNTPYRLARTGAVLLNVKIRDPQGQLYHKEVLESHLSSYDRWASLDLYVGTIDLYAARFPASFPRLARLSFTGNEEDFVLNTSFPQLKWINFHSSSFCWWDPCILLGNLKEFHASGSDTIEVAVEKLLDFFRSSPNLEILELVDAWLLESVETNEYVDILVAQPVDLPKLKALRLDRSYPWEVVLLLSCIRAPRLQNLMLSIEPNCNGSHIPTLLRLDALHLNLPSLRKVTLKETGAPDNEIIHLLAQMREIQSLSLIADGYDVHPALTFLLMEPALAKMASQLKTIYLDSIPISKLHESIIPEPLGRYPRPLLRQATWMIRSGGADHVMGDAAETEKFLADLHLMIPRLKSVEEDLWSD